MGFGKYWSAGAAAWFLLSCGGGDGGGGKSGGGASYGDISSAVSAPTGTVDKSTAKDVASEFEKTARAPGMTSKQSGTQTMSCPAGGNFTVEASGNQTEGSAEVTYDKCCYPGSCCFDGGATTYYAKAGETSTDTSNFSLCANASLTLTCGTESPVDVEYEYCLGTKGVVYVVRISGATFAVSGSYSNGNGTLEIRGKNGTYSCTYTNGAGTCTGDTGEFSF